MATLRSTGSAVLGTVTTTANSAVKIIGVVGLAADYAHDWMSATVEDQRMTLALDKATSKERALVSAAKRQAENDIATLEFCRISPDHQRLFDANMAMFRKALEA